MADGYAAPSIQSDPHQPADVKVVDLTRLKKMYEEWFDLTADARRESAIDQDYYDTKQWTAAEKAALRRRKQPDSVHNRIKPAINGIIGVTERDKSEPRAFPRTPQDEDTADVATDVLRYIADKARFHRIKQDSFLDMLVPGTMAAVIGIDDDKNVTITQLRWEEFFHDPRSKRKDFKDARYLGFAKWMDADDVARVYPEKAEEIEAATLIGQTGLSGDAVTEDRPSAGTWSDRRRKRLRVVEVYYREAGQWTRCVFHGSGVLEEGPSPYTDDKGRPDCAIEAQSAYVDNLNQRYGASRDMRGPQDGINKRHSKLVHLLSVSQVMAKDPSAVAVDVNLVKAEAAAPDGAIPFGWEKVSTSDMAAGQHLLLQEDKAEIERLGPNPAVVGRDNADASGRALQQRTEAGLIELAPIYGGLEDWELRVYRQCWARAKQFWKEPQYIRVTDDENAPRFVGLNQPKGAPVTQPPVVPHPETGEPVPNPQAGQPVVDPKSGEPAEGPPQVDPLTGQSVFGYKNTVAEMDVDITLETTRNTANIQQEMFQNLMELVQANPLYAQQLPLTAAIQLSGLSHKRAILDTIKKAAEEGAQMQAKAAQLAQAAAEAKVGLTQAQTQKTTAEGALTAAQVDNALADPHHKLAVLQQTEAGQAAQHQHEQQMQQTALTTPPPGDDTGGPSGQTDS